MMIIIVYDCLLFVCLFVTKKLTSLDAAEAVSAQAELESGIVLYPPPYQFSLYISMYNDN